MEHGQQGHNSQVSSNRDRGERRGDGQGESNNTSEGWRGGSEGGLEEETEEDRMTAGEPEVSGDTLTASPLGTQDSGEGGLQVGEWAGGSNTRKAPLHGRRRGGNAGPPWGEAGARIKK